MGTLSGMRFELCDPKSESQLCKRLEKEAAFGPRE